MFPREYRGVAFVVGLFLVVQVGALALVPEFAASGYQAVENPDNPANSVLYVVAIVAMTGVMLAAFRYDFDGAIRLLIVGVSAWLSWYVFSALVPPLAAAVPAVAVAVGLLVHPEWYVIDTAGVLMGAGAAGLFGISFGLLPALILLAVLAVYDAVSVYGTEHMLSLAEGVMDLNIPVVLVIPLSVSYSLLDGEAASDEAAGVDADEEVDADSETDAEAEGDVDAAADTSPDADAAGEVPDSPEPGDRDAFFIGLGDAVIPTVLIASAATFSPAANLAVPLLGVNLPALLAMVGTLGGLLVLMRWVIRGRAHAGLPLLNGGAIGGYLIGSIAAGVPLLEALGLATFF
ncbi:presenilin family intramembrane aspartyl protease [Halorubrum ezzemoulense]|jgi:presenilin-like A22 family membrane protease|uniref:Presenilin family intramembrane aspartyl protease n=1 Tax=Halorubrum ezzemoulense TaxID=337243 RepID=A0A256J213_HALEZ|nr:MULTISPECIES: presenilin family intramembrane aspartyl protease PSH [Halorubrum]MDB2223657.1 presenilin family intramembrane aspartyl protease [Halorubrum ezzemoulense]MDB2236558.1 presenilin family intramembrane aspartyl protease [Halorubrum ezzemoulense]MDB2244784.1 presenilin family intramembrane aspartyl protease [Halorubrum ezzemoulense]MDB2248154.1 presenilin family intramembrane aspartyl protease [Halorubrum ezzemoulense]MDB2250991.1 presenilin family intramembrane aspartyl protease 